jgi:hypothetical protein
MKLNHLLDLKQMQANLWEARSSREGAEETAKQGNVSSTRYSSSLTTRVLTYLSADLDRLYSGYHHLCRSKFLNLAQFSDDPQLPLSFMASFFALGIDAFPQDAEGNTSWPLSYVSGLLCKLPDHRLRSSLRLD